MKLKVRSAITTVVALVGLCVPAIAFAATTPTLNQTINPGVLSMDIMQSDGSTPVASPTVNFTAVTKSFSCQTATATLGDTNNKIYVSNLAGGASGWTLALAATGGDSATWTGGGSTYKYNDAAGGTAGCTNGQMTVDPSAAAITLDCSGSCSATNVSKGSSTAYISGTKSSATLMSDSDSAGWKGYLTGVSLSQKIPANQANGNYSLGMTLTVTSP